MSLFLIFYFFSTPLQCMTKVAAQDFPQKQLLMLNQLHKRATNARFEALPTTHEVVVNGDLRLEFTKRFLEWHCARKKEEWADSLGSSEVEGREFFYHNNKALADFFLARSLDTKSYRR